MAGTFTLLAKRIFFIIHVATAIVFLLASLAPYLHPQKWWFISLMGLGFAVVFVLLVFFIFFWLIFNPRYILISIVPLLIGWKSVLVFFAFNAPTQFRYAKTADTIRVVSWNVARFTEWKRNNNKGSQTRLKMMSLLKDQNADILCLQEFYHSSDPVYYDNLNHVMEELGYPYYCYAWDEDGGNQWVGQAIFSRHPILDSGLVRYPRPGVPETLLFADVKVASDTIRFYTTHLQSVQFRKKDFEAVEEIKNREDSLLENSRNIFSKLKRGVVFRARQADIVKELVGNSPYPYIFTGDFNDVPNSYAYFTIRDRMQDAFLAQGFGIGQTYSGLVPTLRIDYIFATPEFQVQQFNRIVKNYSDHYLLVADLKLQKETP